MLKTKLILCALLSVLQYASFFGEGGLLTYWQYQREVSIIKKHNDALVHSNELLAGEIKNLKSDPETIIGRAREDLGLIKPGETFYWVADNL